MVEKRGAVPPYAIALMQVAIKSCTHAKNVEDGIKIRRENVDHYCELIDSSFKIPRSMAARHACMQGWWPANNYLKNPPQNPTLDLSTQKSEKK